MQNTRNKEEGFVSGPYGDSRIKARPADHHWKPDYYDQNDLQPEDLGQIFEEGKTSSSGILMDWEKIDPKELQKLKDWLNFVKTELIDERLRIQSLVALQCSRDSVSRHLRKENGLGKLEHPSLPDLSKIEEEKVHKHQEIQKFINALSENKNRQIAPLLTHREIGFIVEDEAHLIRLNILSEFWTPPSEKEFAFQFIERLKSKPQKNDEHINKIFQTTRKHSLGPFWAGILKFNVPELSTNLNGSRNILNNLPLPRYKVEWINLKTRIRQTVFYDSADISLLLEEKLIEETDGHDKAPKIYPKNTQVNYEGEKHENSIVSAETD